MGISTHTLQKGLEELHSGHSLGKGRVRRDGGGRHATLPQHPEWLRMFSSNIFKIVFSRC
ncbi:MAG: hypothetical protein MR685_00620 [Alistipes sp.]|nr:hypothetical protein [Alistipes sp.]